MPNKTYAETMANLQWLAEQKVVSEYAYWQYAPKDAAQNEIKRQRRVGRGCLPALLYTYIKGPYREIIREVLVTSYLYFSF